jgi:DNA-binding transcriptional regulator YiaG
MMNSIPRLASVLAKPGKRLGVAWKDGFKAEIDLSGLVARLAALAPLADPALFTAVELVDWNTAVGWAGNDDLTLSSETLRRVAEEQAAFNAADFAAWQEALDLSNQEAADVLGVSLNTIKNYRAGSVIPATTALACRALAHDNVAFMARYRPRRAGRPQAVPKPSKRRVFKRVAAKATIIKAPA